MKTLSNRSILLALCEGNSSVTGHRWIPPTKASDSWLTVTVRVNVFDAGEFHSAFYNNFVLKGLTLYLRTCPGDCCWNCDHRLVCQTILHSQLSLFATSYRHDMLPLCFARYTACYEQLLQICQTCTPTVIETLTVVRWCWQRTHEYILS